MLHNHSNSYQDHYQSHIGKATLDKKKLVAGSISDITLSYTIGDHGIDETGALKILFRIASDVGQLQFDNPKQPNYVSFETSNKTVTLLPGGPSTGCKGKQHIRPWSQGFTLHVSGGYLAKGDVVHVQFKNLHIQTYTEKEFQFHIV